MSKWTPRDKKWKALRLQVLFEEDRICHLCGRRGANSVDHLIPASVRPDLSMVRNNLRAAHLACNRQRGNRPIPLAVEVVPTRSW